VFSQVGSTPVKKRTLLHDEKRFSLFKDSFKTKTKEAPDYYFSQQDKGSDFDGIYFWGQTLAGGLFLRRVAD
jgi:hypothetical protein